MTTEFLSSIPTMKCQCETLTLIDAFSFLNILHCKMQIGAYTNKLQTKH